MEYKWNAAAVERFSDGGRVCNHKLIQRSEKIRKTEIEKFRQRGKVSKLGLGTRPLKWVEVLALSSVEAV